MITPQARRQLYAAAGDDRPRSMLLHWTEDRLTLPEDISRRERLRVLDHYFSTIKADLLARLRAAGATVKDLPASPQAIVQATPEQWRELLEHESLESDPRVEILPNMTFEAVGLP